MRHYTLEQWTRFARQEPPLTPDDQHDYEEHLQECDECLELYMQGLELAAEAYPSLSDPQAMMDHVMRNLPCEEPRAPILSLTKPPAHNSDRRGKTWLGHPLFHYTVAAAITLILMSSGAFTAIMDRLQYESNAASGESVQTEFTAIEGAGHTPVSQMIMNKTIVMLDSIQAKHEQGGTQ